MFKFFHGAPYAVYVELKNFYLCVLFWRSFVCCVCGSVRVWECAGVGTYGGLCGGEMWGESGRVGCIRSRV